MSAQANVHGFLLELAAEGIAPVIGGCAGAIVAGPVGVVGGAVVGRVVEKAINFFGPRIVEKWLGWLRRHPKNEQVEAVASLGTLSVEQARRVAGEALDRLAAGASPEDKALALEYVAAIPEAVQQSLVQDLTTGRMTVPSSLSLESPQSLMQLLPTDVPPYAAPTQLPGTQYFLKRVVGTGGFGVVYEAEASSLQHLPMAIKFCLDISMLDMLKRERDNLATLMASAKEKWSPQIVRLYGYDLKHATPFLIYEFVPGGNLTNHLAKRREEAGGILAPDEILGLVRQITEALAFAHERGLVHRDLKPANVLVNGTMLKLADFGIGGIVAAHAAAHSQIGRSIISQLHADEQVSLIRGSGTPLYMDPEQRRGGDPNPKHDLYSLGVVWYQLLIGDVTRELHAGWAEELASRFNVPKGHIEIIEHCVGWIDNRPKNAVELLKLLQSAQPKGREESSPGLPAKVAELERAADTPLRKRIVEFVKLVGEPLPYKPVCSVNAAGVQHIKQHYLPKVVTLPEATKKEVLSILETTQSAYIGHSRIREWGRCAAGIAVHLLWPNVVADLSTTDIEKAADVVARLSGWYHTNGNVWKKFKPTAENVGNLVWGSMEKLKKQYGKGSEIPPATRQESDIMARITSRQEREAELRNLAASGSPGITALNAILLQHKRGQGPLPRDISEVIREILDYEFPPQSSST